MKRLFIRLLLLCCLTLALPGLTLAARDLSPEIKDIIVTTSDADLLLFATVKNGFTEEMLEGVKAGMPIVFTFHMELVKSNRHWLDASLVESTFTHTLTYDASREEYAIAFSGQENKVTTGSLEKAKQLMAELNGVKVIALNQLVPDAPYAIHMQAVLKQGLLPFNLGRFVPIWQISGIQTDRRTIEFRY